MSKEYEFLVEHSSEISQKYKGEWIAVVEDKIVAHGKDFKNVAEEARKVSGCPVFDKIPEEDVVVYASYRIFIP